MTDRIDPLGLLPLVPRVKRARGFRLYLENGKRLLDLWQYGGAAILGHTPPRVLVTFKDAASRGLFAPLPSAHARRFGQALSRLVPGREVRWYPSAARAEAALSDAGFPGLSLAVLPDPAFADPPCGCSASLWRPWVPVSSSALPDVLAPVLPLPHPACPSALLLSPSVAARFPASEPVSPVLLAAAARALSDLSAELSSVVLRPGYRLEKAIRSGDGRTLRGPYLRMPESLSAEAYALLFKRLLSLGFLLPPDPALPVILPGDLSDGEEKALAAALLD